MEVVTPRSSIISVRRPEPDPSPYNFPVFPLLTITTEVVSDGSTDSTEKKVESFIRENIQLISLKKHIGKNSAINQGIKYCSGEIVIFSDVDAILESNAILNLVRYFSDPTVGGVCGQRVIYEDRKGFKYAQSNYIKFDSTIKILESKIGSISSNDGKLYAIRSKLFEPIHPAVTDDLYTALSIIKQHYRFVFEPDAKAFVKIPSRNPHHELERRRRIVCRSLRGLFIQKAILNPFNYGIISINLFINKVNRRLLPIYLCLTFISSFYLSLTNPLLRIFFIAQILFYALSFFYPPIFQHLDKIKNIKRLVSLSFYFCIGNYGTFLGLIDFLTGKEITKWDPLKSDK